jgi:hypothetical protein
MSNLNSTTNLKKKFWLNLEENSNFQNLIINKPYIKSWIIPEKYFNSLKKLSLKLITNSNNFKELIHKNPGESDVMKLLSTTTSFVMDKNVEILTEIDNEIFNLFSDHNIIGNISGIQFPADVRVVHPKPPEGYLNKPHATDYAHCDPWVGAPPDIVNFILYIDIKDDTSYTEIYDVSDEDLLNNEKFIGKGYKDAAHLIKDTNKIKYNPQCGQAILFDGFVPHKTVRKSGGLRISIDLRFRLVDPYSVIDERWDNGLGAWDFYWYPGNGKAKNFFEKWDIEKNKILKNQNQEILQKRLSSLFRHFKIDNLG